MNQKQLTELQRVDLVIGIAPKIKEKLNQLDKNDEIKPHFTITPILYMLVDNIPLNEKNYKEYNEEYGWL